MKKVFLSTVLIFSCFYLLFSQDKSAKFTVTVSTDSILMDNYFEVKFTLENADGQNFEAPDFNEHFHVISGPNFSTSMSIVNGRMAQSMTITYYVEPKEIGLFYILPASVQTEDKILETSPLEILVVPNPDGIKQSPPRGKMDSFQFNFGDPFGFDFFFPDFKDLPQQSQPFPKEKAPAEQPKKKRKTTRI
ncbi:MAG: BatD family protein [Saprospiraceae bacterium]|nr:BatD family protein [Saprospiraceae bacterium]MCF8248797.1 BatD family protein [Saprospiraceae bacterium]MCF8279912.1 BatD family protein [Bacteroidales bacterium]MCF8310082.1 BatD family protein [Saprospiraceae bacterium]MCF8438982.1 BatD family protein [Saprospiraceae bacterium]